MAIKVGSAAGFWQLGIAQVRGYLFEAVTRFAAIAPIRHTQAPISEPTAADEPPGRGGPRS